MNNKKFHLSTLTAAVLGLSGCLGGDSATTGTTSSTATASFPSGLAVASPTARSTSSARILTAAVTDQSATGSQYAWATKKIADLLSGSAAAKDLFDANLLTQVGGNATCYGPTMAYVGHPGGSPSAGQLPSGDLGIWKESEPLSGVVCAAAELNQQLNGVSSHTIMGLVGLASMVSVAKAGSLTIPSAGASLNVLSAMNAAGIPNVTFTTATLGLSSDGKTWSYALALNYTQMSKVRAIALNLAHAPGASDNEYKGMLTYRVDSDAMGGNCGTVTDATINGTLYYNRSSATSLVVNAREGGYCNKGVTGATIADSGVDASGTYLFLDPAALYDGMTKTNGWANSFSAFSGKFNPSTQEGDYVYAWQAGKGDSNSRTFQIHLNAEAASGEAYFGFGDAISVSDGSIKGMICNWAGPGNDHTPLAYAQRQSIAFDGSKFVVGSTGSDITYAPTTSCAYEGTPTGFYYDRDQNSSADSSDKVLVYSSMLAPSGQFDLDLMKKDTATSVQTAINARGFTPPPF